VNAISSRSSLCHCNLKNIQEWERKKLQSLVRTAITRNSNKYQGKADEGYNKMNLTKNNKMNLSRNKKITYWASTLFFIIPAGLMGFVEVATGGPENIVAMVTHLGYPLYIVRILGMAKALGMVAIVTGLSPRLKEWGYAGFVINLLGAMASHHFVGDGAAETLLPFSMLIPTLISYWLWHKVAVTVKLKRTRFINTPVEELKQVLLTTPVSCLGTGVSLHHSGIGLPNLNLH
jgi:hypothetical protein